VVSAVRFEEPTPEVLYDEGRKAYRLGDFQTAVEKWEQAYDLSDNGLLLYNISLAYKGLYSITNDLGDLRRARAILDNFIKVAKANPDIDPDDAPDRLVELDAMIAEAEKAAEENKPPPPVVVQPNEGDQLREKMGPDPGRKLRLAGMGSMIGGGAVALTGVALAAVYALKSAEFKDNLSNSRTAFAAEGCESGSSSSECVRIQGEIDTWRDNGKKANLVSVSTGVVLGGVGVVALVAGGLVFHEGNKRTKQWERGLSDLRVLPTGRGLVVSGRF
jgi:tetratricopeptide (TPR) repeat protein